MRFISDLLGQALLQVLVSLSHNWPFLLASILIAAALKAFVDASKVGAFLCRFRGAGILAATAAAVGTPLCSCGTTAVILGMMASTMPWAPIVAFMVASPLSSPEGLIYSAGLFGWPFALSYFAASIFLGLAGGGIAAVLEKRGFLEGQARVAATRKSSAALRFPAAQAIGRSAAPAFSAVLRAPSRAPMLASATQPSCACAVQGTAREMAAISPAVGKALAFSREALSVARKLLPLFLGFAFLGYLINGLVPAAWIQALFGRGRAYSVPLAATIGLPLYLNAEASLPLARALLDSGMSQGAIMAFLIAGSGTSMGAIAGALTIARWKVVGLVVAVLWAGAVLAGYGFDLLAAAGLA